MRTSHRTLAVATCIAVATSIVGIVNLAGAATHSRATATSGVIVTTAAGPEIIKAGSTTPVSLKVTVSRYKKPDAKVKVYLNLSDLKFERGDCSPVFVNAMEAREQQGFVGATNSKGQLTLGLKYEAEGVRPGSFCVIYGGILGGKGINLNGKTTGTTKLVGVDFAIVICQTNPADDAHFVHQHLFNPYTVHEVADTTAVTIGGPNDQFKVTVKKSNGSAAYPDRTIFFNEVYSTWNSCGLQDPLPPPGAPTYASGNAFINYEPSTTAGTCKVTSQEADTGILSNNTVTITQSP